MNEKLFNTKIFELYNKQCVLILTFVKNNNSYKFLFHRKTLNLLLVFFIKILSPFKNIAVILLEI